jgi:hypothetical protein
MLRAVLTAALVTSLALVLAACTRSGERKRDPGERAARPATGAAAPVGTPCQHVTGAAGATTWTVKTPCESPDSYFAVAVDGPGEVAAGAPAAFRVAISPGRGYKINYCPPEEEQRDQCSPYPVKLDLEPAGEVATGKARLTDDDAARFDKEQLVMEFEARPGAAGAHAIPASFRFAVCDDSTCIPAKVEFAFRFDAR